MPDSPNTDLPLAGLRVLDLSTYLPGPLCTMLLADWGAEVIKVEPRLGGDLLRSTLDPVHSESAYFLGLNRNKKSLAVELKKEAGRAIVLRLARTADVFVESYRPGKAARLGLGYEALRGANPRLVYLSLSGYGQEGPWSGRAGHDLNYLALAGVLSLLADREGRPIAPGIPLGDIAGAFMGLAAVLAALWGRERSGRGRYIDATIYESGFYWLAPIVTAAAAGLPVQPGHTGLTGTWPCYGVYETRDGRAMTLGAIEPHFWSEFCRMVGRDDWVPYGRAQGAEGERVRADAAALFAGRTQAEWVELLAGADVCCEPVLGIAEAQAHPQAQARGLAAEVISPTEGPLAQVGTPAGMGALRLPPPRLGEHTAELLGELGYSREEIDGLVEARVVAVCRKGRR
ncbi:MAG TPA: CaiB/BaiF CoA-transferase family protein [Anaerolineae bacterium]|nr:CaiB/BaiF CoA-transferase family protein [Anaerolineae bacterium]